MAVPRLATLEVFCMTQFATEWTWLDGEFRRSEEAVTPILSHTLHYGLGVFEGTRCYQQADGSSAVFRLDDHLVRLAQSAHIMQLPLAFSVDELRQATLELVHKNQHQKCYIRHLLFIGGDRMGLYPGEDPQTRLSIHTWDWGAYLGQEGLDHGIRCRVSSFVRPFPNSFMTKSKTVGNYVNSILAKREAVDLGYDEALMLDTGGNVAEGSGENLFMVRRGQVFTPPLRTVLDGITRNTVIAMLADDGVDVREADITRDELYTAEEVLLTGTAAEITPVREVDDRRIGSGEPGPITKRLQERFFGMVAGDLPGRRDWLAPVASTDRVTA